MGFSCKVVTFGVVLVAFSIGLVLRDVLEVPDMPELPRDAYWGPGEYKQDDESIRPFKIDISNDVIDDLNHRLDLWLKRPSTPPLEDQEFRYGFNTNYLREVVQYWRKGYQWKDREIVLNKYPQFKTMVNGLDIHFLHVKPQSAGKKLVIPLLLLHGWPGSVKEFYDIVPYLTTQQDNIPFVFELVIPSLPGYGFSDGASKSGLGVAQIAVVMDNLMKRLGLEKYYVQGGDWGAVIINRMGTMFPDSVLGVHSNLCFVNNPTSIFKMFVGSIYPPLVVDKKFEHLMYPLSKVFSYMSEESGYMHLQATKPDTIGTALRDTPVGLAAYILEKFSTWTNPIFKTLADGGLSGKFKLDDLLDNVMIYWVTGSITTSQRIYSETLNKAQLSLRLDEIPIHVPVACARFPHDITWHSECLLKTHFKNLVQITDFKDGGHFAAFELPKELSDDIYKAVRKMEIQRFERTNQ